MSLLPREFFCTGSLIDRCYNQAMSETTPGKEAWLSKIDTGKLMELVASYNERFSAGRMAGLAFLKGLPNESAGMDLDEQKADSLLTLEELKEEAKPILEATGLALASADTNMMIGDDSGGLRVKELRVDIANGSKFVAYLQALEPQTLTKGQAAGLEKVMASVTEQFQKEYDLDSVQDDRVLELMGNLSTIVDEYKHLGSQSYMSLSQSVSKLEKYLTVARAGYLREYRDAEDLMLTEPFDGDGYILRWHIDSTPAQLEDNWNGVLAVLQKISQNEKAAELYEMAIKTAKEALESAIAEVTKKPGNPAFLGILNKTKARLKEF